jgi:hypothetical protein
LATDIYAKTHKNNLAPVIDRYDGSNWLFIIQEWLFIQKGMQLPEQRNGRIQVEQLWFMNNSNRDLLVLFNQELMSPQALEHEVILLHELLYKVEQVDNIIIAHELLDLQRYKVVSQELKLRKYIKRRQDKPFVFLNNKN